MRRQIGVTTFLMVFLGWSGHLLGQDPRPATTAGKIGIINIQAAIASTAEGKKALADLQTKYQNRQQELVRQQQEIQALQDDLQKKATTLSEEEQIRLTRQLEEKQKLFTRSREDFDSEEGADRQDAIQRIGKKMVGAIQDYAKQSGYSLILDNQVPVVSGGQGLSGQGQIRIYYAGQEVDVTDEIVKRYDAANPAGTASAPGSAPARSPVTRPPVSIPRPHTPAAPPPKPTEKPKP